MFYLVYGEVVFSTAQRRRAAGQRLDNFATRAGFTTAVPESALANLRTWYGNPWGPGRVDHLVNGLPALRVAYVTQDRAIADEVVTDGLANWNIDQDGSWLSWSEVL